MNTAFVVSTGRTGTGLLTRLINETTENGFSLHEPWPAFRRRARRLMSGSFTLYDRLYFALPRRHRSRKSDKDWYVENNFQLFAAIPLLRRAFPKCRIILIVRDGRDVVTSYLNRFRYITSDHIIPENLPADPAREQWPDWTPVQKLAWYWVTVNRHVMDQDPDLVLRYEDCFDAEHSGLFRLLDSLPGLRYGRERVLEVAAHRVNTNRQAFFPDYPEWPEAWKAQFNAIAGDTMVELGYAHSGQ